MNLAEDAAAPQPLGIMPNIDARDVEVPTEATALDHGLRHYGSRDLLGHDEGDPVRGHPPPRIGGPI